MTLLRRVATPNKNVLRWLDWTVEHPIPPIVIDVVSKSIERGADWCASHVAGQHCVRIQGDVGEQQKLQLEQAGFMCEGWAWTWCATDSTGQSTARRDLTHPPRNPCDLR
jgi:hypothetical protein